MKNFCLSIKIELSSRIKGTLAVSFFRNKILLEARGEKPLVINETKRSRNCTYKNSESNVLLLPFLESET